MKQKYLISVIVPVYNVRDYLEECLDSVTGQTLGFENIQLILVNDGSKDDSGASILTMSCIANRRIRALPLPATTAFRARKVNL